MDLPKNDAMQYLVHRMPILNWLPKLWKMLGSLYNYKKFMKAINPGYHQLGLQNSLNLSPFRHSILFDPN